eukprot:scaffold117258_cov101-Phaeocystis_antarctica.AAC.2
MGSGVRRTLSACGRAAGWRRAVHHRHAQPATLAPSAGRAMQRLRHVPMRQCQLGIFGRLSARRAILDRAHACARARSRVVRPIGAGHAAAAWLHAAVLVQRSAWCTESSIHACPARLPSGTDSWLGTGMGVGQRAALTTPAQVRDAAASSFLRIYSGEHA